jgi:hypothetical protein
VAQRKWANANPFQALNGVNNASNFFRKTLKALEGGWIFQGKNKHKVKLDPTRPEAVHPTHLAELPSRISEKKKVQKYLEFHHSFFESLGILLLKKEDHYRARV